MRGPSLSRARHRSSHPRPKGTAATGYVSSETPASTGPGPLPLPPSCGAAPAGPRRLSGFSSRPGRGPGPHSRLPSPPRAGDGSLGSARPGPAAPGAGRGLRQARPRARLRPGCARAGAAAGGKMAATGGGGAAVSVLAPSGRRVTVRVGPGTVLLQVGPRGGGRRRGAAGLGPARNASVLSADP